MSDQPVTAVLEAVEWAWLEPHFGRGALVLVASALDLAQVGEAIAQDRKEFVQQWIGQGFLSQPSVVQVDGWRADEKKVFKCVIVQPYVLIQEHELKH